MKKSLLDCCIKNDTMRTEDEIQQLFYRSKAGQVVEKNGHRTFLQASILNNHWYGKNLRRSVRREGWGNLEALKSIDKYPLEPDTALLV
ncbi:MAG: hypothetical protein JXX14_04090 [Deltaproteobacteria bacterium]|nr:hypothetical protein [Deltaproteobacteria bacterium]